MTIHSNVTQEPRSARTIMDELRQIHYPALYDETDKWYCFKLISLYAAISEITLSGDYAEFGVYKGRCAKFIESFLLGNRKLHLFDSFKGLPENWIGPWKKGSFSLDEDEIPEFSNPNVTIHKGLFSETIPVMRSLLSSPLSFIHADADLYESTMDLLQGLNDHIVPGTIILFDEYVMEHKHERDEGEHLALVAWSSECDRKFEYLWRTHWCQVAVRITG